MISLIVGVSMKVSVIVPVYDVEDYIDKCLDSLVHQTLKDMEIIVVNDGSPDNSEEIIKKYEKKYKNVKYVVKKNGGLSDARNYGLKYAKGDYIGFVDSDDYVASDMFEKLYNKIIEDDSDVSVCEFVYVYPDGKMVRSYSNLNYTNEVDKKYLISPPMAWTRLYKKDLFKELSFKKGIYYEDLEMNPKVLKYTKKISFVDEGLYYYIVRNNSIMRQNTFKEKLLHIFDILDNNKKLLYKDYPDEIEYMYIDHLLRNASLRFMEYDNYKENINRIVNIFKKDFPNWKKNKYLKQSSKKMQILCKLAYNKRYMLLRLIKKVKGI